MCETVLLVVRMWLAYSTSGEQREKGLIPVNLQYVHFFTELGLTPSNTSYQYLNLYFSGHLTVVIAPLHPCLSGGLVKRSHNSKLCFTTHYLDLDLMQFFFWCCFSSYKDPPLESRGQTWIAGWKPHRNPIQSPLLVHPLSPFPSTQNFLYPSSATKVCIHSRCCRF